MMHDWMTSYLEVKTRIENEIAKMTPVLNEPLSQLSLLFVSASMGFLALALLIFSFEVGTAGEDRGRHQGNHQG
jgi:hypothetical protein